MIIYDLN